MSEPVKCRLDIRLGSQRLHDQFVWDVNNTEHDPDTFARVLCKDLSADKAFVPLVAWHIRQQVHCGRHTLAILAAVSSTTCTCACIGMAKQRN